MASSVLQVRVDESLRARAAAIYEDLGIDLQTAVRIFLKRSVREKGLLFIPSKYSFGAEKIMLSMFGVISISISIKLPK